MHLQEIFDQVFSLFPGTRLYHAGSAVLAERDKGDYYRALCQQSKY